MRGVTEEPEAGDIGGAPDAASQCDSTRFAVQGAHTGVEGIENVRRKLAGLGGGGKETRAERLGEKQHIAGPGGVVAEKVPRIRLPGHAEAELQLLVDDRVTAHDDGSRVSHGVVSATKDFR